MLDRLGASLPHVPLGPLRIFDGRFDDAVRVLSDAMAAGTGARVATANLDFVALARRDGQLAADLAASDIVVADGVPVVLLSRLMGARSVERCTGVDLTPALCEAGARNGPLRVVMYGSEPAVTERAAAKLESQVPGVEVPLRLHPPFRALTPAERDQERASIREARPHLVLVALGCPRQERRIQEYYDAAPQAVWMGVGATLDFLAGHRRRAPRLVQWLGLEWAFRFVQEPRRLWSRYFRRDLPALVAISWWCLRHRGRVGSLDGR
jgi:N-acetylglucosaminyldiphosphoundecaprenol N-acetyl-beta-D-mannosaminyltransferase